MNGLRDKLDELAFPTPKAEVLAAFDDHELGLPDDETTTLGSVLEPVGVEEFQSPDDLIETVSQMVGRDAVGRPGQTGRGTSDITPRSADRPPGKPDEDSDDQPP